MTTSLLAVTPNSHLLQSLPPGQQLPAESELLEQLHKARGWGQRDRASRETRSLTCDGRSGPRGPGTLLIHSGSLLPPGTRNSTVAGITNAPCTPLPLTHLRREERNGANDQTRMCVKLGSSSRRLVRAGAAPLPCCLPEGACSDAAFHQYLCTVTVLQKAGPHLAAKRLFLTN